VVVTALAAICSIAAGRPPASPVPRRLSLVVRAPRENGSRARLPSLAWQARSD
jgi:hypothetical protein